MFSIIYDLFMLNFEKYFKIVILSLPPIKLYYDVILLTVTNFVSYFIGKIIPNIAIQ